MTGKKVSGFLHGAFERMVILVRKIVNLDHFGFSDFEGKNAAHTLTTRMHVQHHLRCTVMAHAEKETQDFNDKIHGCVIVIEQDNPVHGRKFYFRPRFFRY